MFKHQEKIVGGIRIINLIQDIFSENKYIAYSYILQNSVKCDAILLLK